MKHIETEDADRPHQVSRRGFLLHAGIGAGAATVAGLGLAGASGAASPNATDEGSCGYRETDHVRRVYALSRF